MNLAQRRQTVTIVHDLAKARAEGGLPYRPQNGLLERGRRLLSDTSGCDVLVCPIIHGARTTVIYPS